MWGNRLSSRASGDSVVPTEAGPSQTTGDVASAWSMTRHMTGSGMPRRKLLATGSSRSSSPVRWMNPPSSSNVGGLYSPLASAWNPSYALFAISMNTFFSLLVAAADDILNNKQQQTTTGVCGSCTLCADYRILQYAVASEWCTGMVSDRGREEGGWKRREGGRGGRRGESTGEKRKTMEAKR